MTSSSPDEASLSQQATASGHGRTTQVGRDQYNTTTTVIGPGAGPAPQADAGLPKGAELVGRDGQIDELLGVLDPTGAGPGVVVVTGLAGVGKTALALAAAHRARERGWFPGGSLFVHLRGYDPAGPVDSEQALQALLRALGIRDDDVPPTAAEQESLYRSELVRRTELGPVLVLADDASATAQLLPLIPAVPGHQLLATSRDALTGPGFPGRLIRLDQLDAQPAANLIARTLTQVRADDPRPQAEPDALREVASHCGGLPLALTIAAAQLTLDPGLPIAELAAGLVDARTRLENLRYEDRDGRTLGVQAAFELSYLRLDEQPARLFRLLSLNPGPDVATVTAAVLALGQVQTARQDLAALARSGLIDEQPVGSNRWRMHDLARLYADELCQRHDDHAQLHDDCSLRQQALERLLEYYRSTTDDHLRALPGQPVPGLFSDHTAALAWLDAERLNLTAAVPFAASTGQPRMAFSLAECLVIYLRQRRYFLDAVTTADHALTIALRLDDRYGEGRALNNLGLALRAVRRFDEAITAHTRDLEICRELGDRYGEGRALNSLGLALREVRRFDEAITAHNDSADIYRELGDRHGEGRALNNLGIALREVRRFDEAITAHTRDLEICRELGDRHRKAAALNNFGLALREVRRFDEAITAHNDSADIYRELGDRHGEGRALNNLGIALQEVRRFDEAITAHTRDLEICRELGDRHGEAATLNSLGLALREVRRFDEAITAHNDSADIYRELGDRHGEGRALNNLGLALQEVRRFDEAITAHTRDLEICRELGDRHGEAATLNSLGLALRKVRRFDEAITAHNDSADIYRELGDRHGEAAALNNLGIALQEVRRFDEAITAHNDSADIYRELGDRHREAATLNNLGIALREVRRFDEAITAHNDSADIYRELGDRHGEAATLNNLGIALRKVRRFDEAITAHNDSADIYRELGDRHGEGRALNDLGLARREMRQSRSLRGLWRRIAH
ncbi:tetratricopeptide repeat protein [Streptomyces asoensis]|uniref:tetratricopeptide repeat protein n=1 Tax=Streptomyces asoensis TaxID=249586 RepID=UPI0033CC4F24